MKLTDLSQTIKSGMGQHFGGPVPYIWENAVRFGEGYETVDDNCILQNHLGTHIDAPRHYNPRHGMSVHELPLERLITPAVILDLRHKEKMSKISAEDLQAALAAAKEDIHPNDAVILHTGMARYFDTWVDGKTWRDSEYAKYPALDEGACRWLLAKKISLIAVDTLAPDRGPGYRPAHLLLLRDNNIPIVENLCNLELVASKRILFVALPPKVEGATGFLVRAVAIEGFSQDGHRP